MITSGQIRAGRALLRWNAADLAEHCGIGLATIRRIEVMPGVPSGQIRTLEAIRAALEAAGIEFIGAPGDAPGVRLRERVGKQ